MLTFLDRRRIEVVHSAECAECSIACLAMVAGYWGRETSLREMRQQFPLSLKGATVRRTCEMAEGMGLSARPVRAELHDIVDLKLPCVLHWDLNHLVVLERLGRHDIVVVDPAIGRISMSLEEFSKHFTGVAIELTPGDSFEQKKQPKGPGLSGLAGKVKGLKRRVAELVALGLFIQILAVMGPFYLQMMVDQAIGSGDRDLATTLAIGFGLLLILQAGISGMRHWWGARLNASFHFQWMSNAFTHLLKLPATYFENRRLGDVASRFSSIQTIQRTLSSELVEGVIDGLLAVVLLGVMIGYSPGMAALSVVSIGIYAGLRGSLVGRMAAITRDRVEAEARQTTEFLETVRGIKTVKVFGKGYERLASWLLQLSKQTNADLRLSRTWLWQGGAQSLVFGLERIVVGWMAGTAVMEGRFTVGMLLAYVAYREQMCGRVIALVDRLMELRVLGMHADRVGDVMLAEPEKAGDRTVQVSDLRGTIEFRDVWFRYSSQEPYAVEGINLRVEEGENVCITGPSGCGKSTLMKLALGLIEPTQGVVEIGGVDVRKLGGAGLAQIVGSVQQDDQLFSGTIADNIAMFDPELDLDRVAECARFACVASDIELMPMGYLTIIGETGAGLSGGQRQRVMLARALYAKPRILVLDEATSALDATNEGDVNRGIGGLEMTRLGVAHRIETIASAQRVVHMRGGRIEGEAPVPGRMAA